MEFIKICDNIYSEDVQFLDEGFYKNKDLNDIVFVDKHKCFFTLGVDFESFMDKYLETNKPKVGENTSESVSVETMLKAIAVANGNVKDLEF
jgi:hypothetical protein